MNRKSWIAVMLALAVVALGGPARHDDGDDNGQDTYPQLVT